MIEATQFVDQARAAGFSLYSGVPCSYLKPLINCAIDSPDLDFVLAAQEGDAVAVATGAALGGREGVAMFQNSGLTNAMSPLTSLNAIFKVPVLVIVTLRGEPGGSHDEPQHKLMGQITTGQLSLMQMGWEFFPSEEEAVRPALKRATARMRSERMPFAFVMRKGAVAPCALRSAPEQRPLADDDFTAALWEGERLSRTDVLGLVQRCARPTDVLLAATGFAGRALYALGDRPSQLYMVGSMGCISSVGLGLALARPERRVVAIDGDGAVLMRMGSLATNGYQRPPNLFHLVLDNEAHESTGGQSTVSHSVDLAAVAHACGYPRVMRASTLVELEDAFAGAGEAATFVHVKTRTESNVKLPRPSITPPEAADRLRAWLQEG